MNFISKNSIKLDLLFILCNYFGLNCYEIKPFLKSFLYKTYCLSQFTFALETTTLNQKSIDFLNVSQNNLIRYMLNLKSRSIMTTLLRALKIHKIEELYISSKLSFLNTLKFNQLSYQIFNYLCEDLDKIKNNSNSFKKDILKLESYFNLDISVILAGPLKLKEILKSTFNARDGLSDSIRICLRKLEDRSFKMLLDNFLSPF